MEEKSYKFYGDFIDNIKILKDELLKKIENGAFKKSQLPSLQSFLDQIDLYEKTFLEIKSTNESNWSKQIEEERLLLVLIVTELTEQIRFANKIAEKYGSLSSGLVRSSKKKVPDWMN